MQVDLAYEAHDGAEALRIGLRGQVPAGPEAELARVAGAPQGGIPPLQLRTLQHISILIHNNLEHRYLATKVSLQDWFWAAPAPAPGIIILHCKIFVYFFSVNMMSELEP